MRPIRSINRVFQRLHCLAPDESNDNAAPRAKVLEFERPPPAPGFQVVIAAEIPADVKDALCHEAGYVLGVTDPAELHAARCRLQKRMDDIATEALIRYVRARNDGGKG